jgi:hypothetical protein
VGQQLIERGIDGPASGCGEPHQHAAAVAQVGPSLDQPACREAVDTIGHRAAGHERVGDESAW